MEGDRRAYKICAKCNDVVLVAGTPRKGDKICPHRFRPREQMTPTVYYENAEGKRLYGWDDKDLPKRYRDMGYERREISGIGAIRKFEKQTAKQMEAEARRRDDETNHEYEQARDRNHSDLRSDMQSMDSFHRELAMEAMQQEQSGYAERYDSNFRVGAYE